MSEDNKRISGTDGTQTPSAKELGAYNFRVETIDDIGRLASISWFPLNEKAKTPESPGGSEGLIGNEVSLVNTARTLAARARQNDHDALLRLFIMATAAQMELWQLSKESTVLQRASQHSVFWFLPTSPIGGLGRLFKDFENLIKLASLLLKFRKIKGNLDIPSNACAFKILAYMVLAKRGFITDLRSVLLGNPCSRLPRLSETTWNKEWWDLAREIAKDMFPNLDKMFFGEKADSKNKDTNYSAAIHHLGMAFKITWPLFSGIEDATLPSKVKDKANNEPA